MQETASITQFGKAIKHRLIDLDKQQTWLIDAVAEKTGLYFDSSYLYKIMIGVHKTPKIISAICEILDIQMKAEEEPKA